MNLRRGVWVLLLGGCATFGPPDPAVLADALADRPEAGAIRRRARLDLEGEHLSGRFTAVLVAWRGPEPSARLQVLPEVGGKLLDLVVTPERVAGYVPMAGLAVDHARGEGPVPRHLLGFVAASLLEDLTLLSRGRVLGSRPRPGGGHELLVAGALEGCRVTVELDPSGAILGRTFRLRGVGWREVRTPDGRRFVAPGLEWRLGDVTRETLAEVPDRLFDLQLPEGLRR